MNQLYDCQYNKIIPKSGIIYNSFQTGTVIIPNDLVLQHYQTTVPMIPISIINQTNTLHTESTEQYSSDNEQQLTNNHYSQTD